MKNIESYTAIVKSFESQSNKSMILIYFVEKSQYKYLIDEKHYQKYMCIHNKTRNLFEIN